MSEQPYTRPSFGTDGLRGRAGQPPMDPETMRRIGGALGLWLQQHGTDQKRVLLGHDGRESAAWIAQNLLQGLAAAEVSVWDAGLIPTPGLAFLTRSQPVLAGIMISASHNPATDNGIKIFFGDGTKLADAAETEIAEISETVDFDISTSIRLRERHELQRFYAEHLVNTFGHLDLSKARIVLDTAHGAGSELGPEVLEALGAEVMCLGNEPDGHNINKGAGALHPERMAQLVKEQRADFGICLDGDGDRSIFACAEGRIWDGDATLCALAPHLQRQDQLPGATVVATVMSNLGLHKLMREAGIRVEVTPVGDRAVVQAMRAGGFGLGGEQSGHVIFGGAGALTGDGLFTALRLLEIPGALEEGFVQTLGSFQAFPQQLTNVPVRDKPGLDTLDEVQAAVHAVEQELGEEGRVLLRYSGTEKLCRVMVEAPTQEQVDSCCARIAAAVREAIGA